MEHDISFISYSYIVPVSSMISSRSLGLEEKSQHPLSAHKLKVTILASEWGSDQGELPTLNRKLAIQLAKFHEVKVSVFVPKCSEEDERTARRHSIEIVRAKARPGYGELELLSFPPNDLQIHVVVGHGVELGRQAQVIRESCQCKWIQVVHTDAEELAMFKSSQNTISSGEKKHKTEVELCKLADFVVGVGPKLYESIRRCLRGCKKDSAILEFTPGVFDEFENVKHVEEDLKSCSILLFDRGFIDDFELKGLDIAGSAVAEIEDARLIFVGAPKGKQEDIAQSFLRCNLPASRLTVRGLVQEREIVKQLFCEVDLLLMPSRTEGFGLTGLEALSAGVPILVSKNSGFGEALSKVPFGASCVVDSEDSKVWAEEIKTVWRKKRKTRLSEAKDLRTSYDEKYSWSTQCKALINKMIHILSGMQ